MYQTFRFQRVVLLGAAIGTAGLVFAAPQCCARALQQGLALCGGPLLVSLFPFLIVSTLLMRCGAGQVLGFVFRPVARLIGVRSPAAGGVLLSGYRGKDPFCDPFCGSGTIAIEAALIAKNRAPGLNRTFSAQKWDWLPSQTWVDGAGEAMDLEYDGAYDIWGGDIDPAAVHLAQANAVKADVEDLVHFTQGDACAFSRQEPYGRIVCNPPYGERLLDQQMAAQLYRDFGRAVRGLPKGWRVSVLSAHPAFERAFGAPADKKRKLYNGMLQCNLYQYGKKPGVSPKQKAN